jgi:hypothetical protein
MSLKYERSGCILVVHEAHSYFVPISCWMCGGREVHLGLMQTTKTPKHHAGKMVEVTETQEALIKRSDIIVTGAYPSLHYPSQVGAT